MRLEVHRVLPETGEAGAICALDGLIGGRSRLVCTSSLSGLENRGKLRWLNGYGWQGMGRGGLILPNAQKSAATPTHPLLASDV